MTDRLPALATTELSVLDALRAARAHCAPGCFGYHAAWRLHRRLGLKGNPRWHTGFYRLAMERLHGVLPRRVRVLVCATSDETMVALWAGLLGQAGHSGVFEVVDACPTPLRLVETHARRVGLEVATYQARAPELEGVEGPFDVAVTDGLLSLLPSAADRTRLVARLADLLNAEGALCYTTRITRAGHGLEYDRLGRLVQAGHAALCWPGPPAQRSAMAAALLARPARTAPFARTADLVNTATPFFASVRAWQAPTAPSVALGIHPAFLTGSASRRVGLLAHRPHGRQQ